MITLITGAPGAGKSAALVQLLSELVKDRPLFVDGVPELKIPHTVMEDARQWPDLVPDGAAVVIDEVQRVWRPRGPGSKVPNDIAMLETHRHRGLDFFIVTQGPRLVDANVRALVGRHVHLRDLGLMGRWWYEWPECSESLAWKSAPVKKRYRLPKAIFDQYKSASMHIKPIRSVPRSVIVLGAALVAVAGLGWYVMDMIYSKSRGAAAPAAAPGEAAPVPVLRGTPQAVPLSPSQVAASFVPRFAEDPGSAPAFDALRPVVAVPRVVGGYCVGSECVCFTQQRTIAPITPQQCAESIRAPRFDPYRVELAASEGESSRAIGR